MENLVIDLSFWKGRKVFLTGHTGFKGSWISLWLKQLGAEVSGYSLDYPSISSMFYAAEIEKLLKHDIRGDIRDLDFLTKSMQSFQPEIVINMAAQSLVRESYVDPLNTYTTNIIGTANVFEAVRNTTGVKVVLNITSDKCYENKESLKSYCETDPMGGYDPYSSSKACSELVSSAYRSSFFQESGVALATARAGNVIGGGDWSSDRIVPDAIRAFIEDKPLLVRNPQAIRPWQHVLEPLSGYLVLCQQLYNNHNNYSEAWNFGPNDENEKPVSFLVDIMANIWGNGASWHQDDSEQPQPHEAFYLKLDCSKARSLLKYQPIWSLERALNETLEWYKTWHSKKKMYEFTICQIETYQQEQSKV